jgi:transposase
LSDKRKYRKFTAQQKAELVLASFHGERSIAQICREHDISETLLRRWRDQMVDAGIECCQAGQDRSLAAEQRRRIVELERALGRKTYQLEIAGKPCLTSYGVSSDPKGRLQCTRTGSVASGRARLTTDDVTPGVDEACGAPHRPPLVSLQGKPRASRANLRCSQAPKVA